jgi:hypothetical protein
MGVTDSASPLVGSPATSRRPVALRPALASGFAFLGDYCPLFAGRGLIADGGPSYPDCFGSCVQIHETFDERLNHSLQTWPVWPDAGPAADAAAEDHASRLTT